MASFGGHALPGALMIILSLLLTVESLLVYYARRAQFRGASCVIVALGELLKLFFVNSTKFSDNWHHGRALLARAAE